MMFGRDKLFNFLRSEYADKEISRRQVAEWLSQQEVNQLYAPSKGKDKNLQE